MRKTNVLWETWRSHLDTYYIDIDIDTYIFVSVCWFFRRRIHAVTVLEYVRGKQNTKDILKV